ncbi:MAG: tetratricopeptide repeat protein, partial [Gammaproteobacteria bacterium]
MYAIGSMYAAGAGTEQDFKKAYQWLNKAALYNRWDAQYKTGLFHYMGMGVPQNYKKAALVYKTLALKEKGYPPAQYRLGLLYVKGHGVEQDNVQAYTWLVMAAHFYRHVIAREENVDIGPHQGLKEMDETEQIAFELTTVTDPIATVFAYIHLNEMTKVLKKLRSEMTPGQLEETRRLAIQYRSKYQAADFKGKETPPVDDILFMTDVFQ